MVSKCANNWCQSSRQQHEGKLFRFDLDLGSRVGDDVRQTEYLWLCPRCARVMRPKVECTGNSVFLRLTAIDNLPDATDLCRRAN